jgi:peptidoglycan/xylan/chitin deacetylase (PgdA/CDA1 family)
MARLLLLALLVALGAAGAAAQPAGQRFVSVAFHDVDDKASELESDSVTTRVLAQFFDWMKGDGWTAISLDDVAAARAGRRPLPDKAILITFDDGYRSLYTHVYPLLQVYRFPVVSALVGSWVDGPMDGTVQYGDRKVPRANFISWAEAREMQASGLVEFASHSYALHRGIQANPQGNMLPAAITWHYDPATRSYETDAQYRERIRADLQQARAQMAANLGRAPRTMVWPFGRFSGPALDVVRQLGFTFALTLEPEPASTANPYRINRYFPAQNPTLGDIVRNLRFEPGRPTSRRIACLSIDALAAEAEGPAQDEALGRLIEGVRGLGANIAVIDAAAGLATPEAPLGDVYFPTRLRPMRRDLLARVVWQIRTRGGADAYVRLPIEAARRAVGEAGVPELFADMMRYSTPDGIAIDLPSALPATPVMPDLPGEVRARRAALDEATLDPVARLALKSYRAAAAIDVRQRLLLGLPAVDGPPDWADIAMLPAAPDVSGTAAIATSLKRDGWLRPDAAGRIALALPAAPRLQVDALRAAQREGAAAFALCPAAPSLPPSPALSASFSAATYAYRP